MIKEKEIEISIGSSNYSHYEKYKPYKKGDKILVKIYDLIENSTVIITAICDICNKEKKIKYQPYNNQIKKSNFYCCSECKMVKTRATNKKKYGFDYPMQRVEVMVKSKNTLLEKYGIENISQRDDIKQKRSKIMCDPKYQKKLKNGVIKKYGVDNASSLQYVKDKKKETTLSNYGVENPSQSSEIFIKAQKSGKKIKEHHTGLFYRGTYEKDFLDFCYKHKVPIEKGKTLKYTLNGKERYYHSDYYMKNLNLIIEIKSNYYYEKYKEQNIQKKISSIKNGFNYIIIIDKEYDEFLSKFS